MQHDNAKVIGGMAEDMLEQPSSVSFSTMRRQNVESPEASRAIILPINAAHANEGARIEQPK